MANLPDDVKQVESGKLQYLTDNPARDPETGLAIDAGTYDEKMEAKRRKQAATLGHYAEEGDIHFDPTGKYLCGGDKGDGVDGCVKFRPGSHRCIIVKGKIDGDCGSCQWWEIYDPKDADLDLGAEKFSKGDSAYGEREPGGTGFGCQRCEYGTQAKQVDSKGRTIWCGIWAAHVFALACCGRNHKIGDVAFEDNRRLTQIEFYKR